MTAHKQSHWPASSLQPTIVDPDLHVDTASYQSAGKSAEKHCQVSKTLQKWENGENGTKSAEKCAKVM